MVGALFAWSGVLPVAWVRLAAVDHTLDVGDWLDLAFPPLVGELRRRGVQQLVWMVHQDWMGSYLSARGFSVLTEVMTLVKSDRRVPGAGAADARLRPALDVDVSAIVAVDRVAFTPHWWHSEAATRRRVAEASHFILAEIAGEVVGYATGELRPSQAHLSRIAVHPAYQGRGIGAMLLRDVLRAFWRRGAEKISLNTQRDNRRSQGLYRRFGFEPTGDVLTAWRLRL